MRAIRKVYDTGKIQVEALRGIDFEVGRGEFVAVVGPSGSGKRTILIITGKGNLGRGVLRENVPKWLAGAKFRLLISGYAESHAVHGGAGAIYIKITSPLNLHTICP